MATRTATVLVDLGGIGGPAQRITIWADDPAAANTPDDPDRVVSSEDQVEVDGPLVLPPHSHVTLVIPSSR